MTDRRRQGLGGAARRPHLLALEPRMMFDAAIAATTEAVAADRSSDQANDAHHYTPDEINRPHVAEVPQDAVLPERAPIREAAPADAPAPCEIIFIDTAVADYRQLADAWAGRGEVVLVDSRADGIDQVRAALAGRDGVAAIHIVSHGEAGVLYLGTTRIDADTIDGELAGSLAAIGRSLAKDGDILLYGCDFAEGTAGTRALERFAAATGADVAASTDTTGAAVRGGDWDLEARQGLIEAAGLDGGSWAHTLDPNTPVPISVAVGSLTVRGADGTVVFAGSLNNYNNNAARSPDVGVGAVATWANAATYQGRSVDLRATVVSLTSGDAVQFNRVTGTGTGPDDPTFLLRDLSTGDTPAIVELRWELVDHTTGEALPADVRFTIADIDGIDGNPRSRETVSASTDHLAYYTRERVSDIHFTSSLDRIEASGTQDENNPVGQTLTPKSAATFDWSKVSSFTLTYTLAPNSVTTNAQFYHDGDADFVYTDPVYVSVPRLDLDGDDSTAAGDDAHFTFTEKGPATPVVDADVRVTNPMPSNGITGGTVVLTNAKAGDAFVIGTLPTNITATIGTGGTGTIAVTLSGNGSEADYAQAFRAIGFRNGSSTPDTTQRVIQVSFSNDTLTTAVATSRIDVVAVNDVPVANPDRVTTPEDTPVTIDVTANDTDADGDTLVVTAASADHGRVTFSGGSVRYVPDADYNGADTIRYTVSDGHGGTASSTIAVTVTPVNDAPTRVGTLPDRTASDRDAVSIDTAGGFRDVDGDRLAYSAAGLPAGLSIDTATGIISGTLSRSASQPNGGVYDVVVTASDGRLATTQPFRLTVTNPPPVAADDGPVTTPEDTAVTIAVLANDSDPDGDPLTVTAATALHGSVRINGDGTLTYTPGADYNGTDTITYTIADSDGGTATARVAVTVTPVNDAPVPIGTPAALTGRDGEALRYATAGYFTDADGDRLTYSATGLPIGLSIDAATSEITGTPDRSASQANGGRYDIVVTARDPSGATATQHVAGTIVNPPPTAVDDGPVSTPEDTAVTIAVLANDSDPDGDPLTVTAATADHGRVVVGADGTLTYTPDADYNGADTIRYTISDGQGGTASAKVDVTVTPVDDAPVAKPIPHSFTASDGAPVRVSVADAFGDPDGDPLTYAATDLPAGLSIDPATGVISGTIDRSASRVNGGVYHVRLTATDPSGKSAVQDVTLTVTNPAPVAADHRATTAEETAVTVRVLDADRDPDGDALTVLDPVAQYGTAVVNPDGSITYTPAADFFGTDTVTYTLRDADGATTEGRITITVTDVEDPPVARDDVLAATEDTPVTFDPRVNDRDPDGDPLTVVAASADHGRVAINADGTLTYTPDADYNGVDQVRYTISDGRGGTAQAVVAVSVAAVDDAPVPVGTPPALAGRDGEPVRYPTAGLFADVDGDRLTYTATGLPAGLSIDAATGEITGTPDRSASQANGGHYTVVVTARDPSGATATQRIDATITNPPPVAADDAARTPEDTPVTIDVLGNDRDPDGDPLTIVAAAADHGRVTINADGSLTYTPDADFNGTDQIRYTISDGEGGTATAIATVVVDPVNDAPVPAAIETRYALADGERVEGLAAGSFRDPDGDRLTYTATGLPAGLSIDPATGAISGVVDRSASRTGSYTVVVTATDPAGLSATRELVLTVTNPAPVAADDRATTAEDTPLTIQPLANDRDPDGDPLTIVEAVAAHGTVLVNADGTLTYIPDPDFHGDDTVRYTISDGEGGTASATIAITVTPVNDAPDAQPLAPRADADSATVSVPVAGAFSDRDGDRLTYSATGLPAGLSIDPVTGVISGTIVAGGAYGGPARDGRYPIVVTAIDPSGLSVSSGFTWTVDPVAPVAQPDAYATPEDTAIALPVLANDRDGDADPLTIVAAEATNGTVVIDGDRLVFTPARDFDGVAVVTYTITDPAGNRATATATITVTPENDAPTGAAIPAASGRDGQAVTLDLGGFFLDVEGDRLRYSATGLPPGLSIDPDTGRVTGTLAADASRGTVYRVVVTATDPSGASGSSAFAWTIVNPAPTATDDRATTPEDTAVVIDVLANDVDPDGDAIRPVAASAAHGRVSINADGTLSYTPDADYHGEDVVTYTIADADGGRATASVLVTVTPVPDAPVAVADPAAVDAVEGRPVRTDAGPLFRDADGDPLRFTATGLPPGLSIDPATGVISGTVTPGARGGGDGIFRVTVTANDPDGLSASTIIEFRIDRAPTVVGDPDTLARTGFEGQPIAVPAGGLFADPDAGDTLVFSATGLPAGLSIDPATGAITGTPARGDAAARPGGVYPVVVTATDRTGGAVSATITITVVNRPPVATDDAATVPEDGSVTIPVLANDRDPGGDPLTVVAASAGSGSVAINADGTLTYRPNPNFAGSDLIRYTVSDGQDGTAEAVVRVTVTPVNDAPVIPARDAPVDAVGGRPVVIDGLAGVTDVDGDRLQVTGANAAVGTVAIGPDGRLVYAPPLGFVGTTSITYTVSDGRGGFATATIVVRVADGRGADICQLLRIGRVRFPDPVHAAVSVPEDGEVRNPLSVALAVDGVRSLRGTAIGGRPVLDAVNGLRDLRGSDLNENGPITGEVARLGRLADFRDAGDRLFDQRWGDFFVHGMSGFSAAADGRACVMVESVVRGGAIYLEVRDIATDGRAAIRSVDVTPARGDRHPDWLRVDHRGLAIVERAADMDELHLVVRVTREDGRVTTTRIVVQGATGEVELDRPPGRVAHAPLHATQHTPAETRAAAAARLAASFE